jgi:hypothetical protein
VFWLIKDIFPISVNVSLTGLQNVPIRKLPAVIAEIENPQVIIWYSGEDGLTERSRCFYQDNFLNLLAYIMQERQYHVYFYYCRAWKGLKDRNVSLVAPIESFAFPSLCVPYTVIQASDFFTFLLFDREDVREERMFLNETLINEKFIWDISFNSLLNGIIFNVLLPHDSVLGGSRVLFQDSARAYSALRYIEGLWLIREIIMRTFELSTLSILYSTNPINIVCVLPSSGEIPEYMYYCPNGNVKHFRSDVSDFLLLNSLIKLGNQTVNIYFWGFEYMCGRCTRPYEFTPEDTLLV